MPTSFPWLPTNPYIFNLLLSLRSVEDNRSSTKPSPCLSVIILCLSFSKSVITSIWSVSFSFWFNPRVALLPLFDFLSRTCHFKSLFLFFRQIIFNNIMRLSDVNLLLSQEMFVSVVIIGLSYFVGFLGRRVLFFFHSRFTYLSM